ncbi:MAG: hypothetical protein FJ184_10340 [Gammaproteobacteria bacterium]|nr:hypothetical protein [Gammaproteobacteria bacterium]
MNETPNPVPATRTPTPWLLGLAFLGVVVAVVFGRPLLEYFREKPEVTPPEIKLPEPQAKVPPKPEDVAKPHLSKAEKEAERVIDEHVKAIDAFFADSKMNTGVFAREVLGFRSKLLLVSDGVPKAARSYMEVKDKWWFRILFSSTTAPPLPIDLPALAAEQAAKLKDDRHKIFIREKFEEQIFTPAQLDDVVQQVVKSYIAEMRSIESKMLVDLRADVSDFPATYPGAQLDDKRLQESYDQALSRAIEATGGALQGDIATQLVSIIAGEVLAQVAVRLGVSAGILGTGAASGWATFGIGVVVGLIVDQIVSWVWDWWADPRGNLAADLDRKLDEMNRLIVDGSTDVQGLRARLQQFSRERAATRRTAVLSLLQPTGGGTK